VRCAPSNVGARKPQMPTNTNTTPRILQIVFAMIVGVPPVKRYATEAVDDPALHVSSPSVSETNSRTGALPLKPAYPWNARIVHLSGKIKTRFFLGILDSCLAGSVLLCGFSLRLCAF